MQICKYLLLNKDAWNEWTQNFFPFLFHYCQCYSWEKVRYLEQRRWEDVFFAPEKMKAFEVAKIKELRLFIRGILLAFISLSVV